MAYSLDFSGRVALVTGASGGLGAQFAKILSRAGAAVVLASRRMDKLKDLRAQIEGEGGDAHVVMLDVTDTASFKAAVAYAETEVGPIDILVNNSGVSTTHRLQQVGKRMLARSRGTAPGTFSGGRIINIASMAGLRVLPQIGVYCMSKVAVVQMTKAMALEWGKFGCGFWVQSPNWPSRKADPAGTTQGVAAKLVSDPNNPTPRSTTITGKPSRAKNWCKCCRANALASRKTWMPCWSCWPAVKATSSMVR